MKAYIIFFLLNLPTLIFMSLGKKTKVRNMKFIFACICGLVLAFHWSTLAYRVNMHHTQSDILALYIE